VKTRKLKRSAREVALLWLVRGDRVWLVRRPSRGVWAGLWSLPEFGTRDEARQQAAGWPGQTVEWPAFTHVLTHLDLYLKPMRHELPAGAPGDDELAVLWPDGRWVGRAELGAFGLPAPIARLLASSDDLLGTQELVDQDEPLQRVR
jgi:A/G-specific adenine glycosylase